MNMQTNASTKSPRNKAGEAQASATPRIKPLTKASLLERLLLQDAGVTLADLGQATGWLPHTCRAFLTGLRKKGRNLERGKREDGMTIYKLASNERSA